jgi:predicted TIM-barrel fold metal-dependent hydrolase
MDELGIEKTVLVGSGRITLTLRHRDGFTRVDENNEELIKIIEAYPRRFEAWPTLDPTDEHKLEKLQSLVERGATGLKLYLGHGLVSKVTGDWMFGPVAMDDSGMMPVYEYCEREFIPICFHANPGPKTPGFAQEFVAVLERFPNLKVNCPHFMLSSIRDSRLREFLDTYPNLYTDISYGHDDFLASGLRRMSKAPEKYTKLLFRHPDRFLFATDCVITGARRKNAEWITARYRSYLDALAADWYTTPVVPGTRLRGLELPPDLVDRILYRNYREFIRRRPRDTRLERAINWRMMGVKRLPRDPGQRLPPP